MRQKLQNILHFLCTLSKIVHQNVCSEIHCARIIFWYLSHAPHAFHGLEIRFREHLHNDEYPLPVSSKNTFNSIVRNTHAYIIIL